MRFLRSNFVASWGTWGREAAFGERHAVFIVGIVRAFCMFLCVLHVDVTCLSYLHVAGILNSAYSSSPMEAGRMRIQRPSESNDQAMMWYVITCTCRGTEKINSVPAAHADAHLRLLPIWCYWSRYCHCGLLFFSCLLSLCLCCCIFPSSFRSKAPSLLVSSSLDVVCMPSFLSRKIVVE